MPSVGTLNLTVESNAATVGSSLEDLAGALGRVKKAIPDNGLGLPGIAEEIKTFVSTIKTIESSSTAFKSIESLGNGLVGIAKFMKYSTDSVKESTGGLKESISTINTQPAVNAINELKAAIGDGLKLGQAGTQLKNIRDAINGEWNSGNANIASSVLQTIAEGSKAVSASSLSTTAKNIGNLAKSLGDYADSISKVSNTPGAHDYLSMQVFAPVGESKTTGANIGYGMMEGMESTLAAIERVADAIADAVITRINGRLDINSPSRVTKQSGKYAGIGLAEGLDESAGDVKRAALAIAGIVAESMKTANVGDYLPNQIRQAALDVKYYGSALDAVLPKVQAMSSAEMIAAENARYAAMSERERKVFLAELNGELKTSHVKEIEPEVQAVSSQISTMKIELQEIGDVVTSVIVPAFQEMYQIWSLMAYQFGMFQSHMARLTAGDSPLLLGNGRTPGQLLLGDGTEQETFLSTWVRTGEQWKQNWVLFASEAAEEMRAYFQPDWIMGGQSVPQSMSTFHLGAGPAQLLLGDGGVSPDNMLSTFVDETEQWKQNWIIGEGTVSETAEEASKVVAWTYAAAKAAEMTEARFQQILEDKREEAELAEQIRQKQLDKFYEEKQPLSLEQTNEMADNITQLDLLKAKLGEAEAKYNDYVNTLGAGAVKTLQAGLAVQDLRDKIWEYRQALAGVTEEQESAEGTAITLSSAWSFMKTTMKKMFPTLASLLGRFQQIVKYRMLRSVLRYITSGFSEGVKNLYQYSKAVGTDFAPAMDDAASTLLKLKNSIGASVAPLIQALVPVLQTVVNWVVQAINFLNQMFALLRGQTTWTKAVDTATEAYKNNTKEAKNASKAAKDMLADWDELNIIQSNSGGSGGGAGSGNNTDYSNMFEEVNKFSESAKNTIKFIEDHLGGLKSLFIKLGALLLGWKFSKAFTGFLGKLGKLVAGGALVVIGLEFSYGAGFEAGAKGYWDTQDILRGIVGGLATAIGGSLITSAVGLGGGLGFAIGLTLAAVVTLVGWLKGQKELQDKNKWGNLTMTREEIEKFVEGQFTFDVKSAITILDGVIKNETEARNNLNQKIDTFKQSLNDATVQASISVDSSKTGAAVTKAYEDSKEAIKAVEELMKVNHDGLSVLIKSFKLENAGGEDITDDLMESISVADTTVKNYFTGIGEQLAKWVSEGERTGWEKDVTQNALALMEREKKILEKAQEYKNDFDFDTKLQSSMDKIVDKETAVEQRAYQDQLLAEYREKAEEALRTKADTATELAAIAQAAADDALEQAERAKKEGDQTQYEYYMGQYQGLIDSVNTYKTEATSALNSIDQIDTQLKATVEKMNKQWETVLSKVYGEDYRKGLKNFGESFYDVTFFDAIFDPLGTDYILSKESFLKKGVIETAKKLREKVIAWVANPDTDPNGFAQKLINNGSNPFNLLNDETKQDLIKQLYDATGNLTDVEEILHQAFNMSYDEIEPYIFDIPVQPQAEVVEPKATTEDVSWGIFDILRYHPPEIEAPVKVTLDPQVEEDELFNKLQAALRDNVFSDVERKALEFRYGKEALEKMLETLGVKFGEDGVVLNPYGWGKGSAQPKMVGVVGAAGTSTDYGGFYRGGTQTETGGGAGAESDVIDYERMSTSVSTGNGDVVSELRTMVVQLQRLLNKQWTVQVSPSTAWGNNNYYSNQKRGKVTGEVE